MRWVGFPIANDCNILFNSFSGIWVSAWNKALSRYREQSYHNFFKSHFWFGIEPHKKHHSVCICLEDLLTSGQLWCCTAARFFLLTGIFSRWTIKDCTDISVSQQCIQGNFPSAVFLGVKFFESLNRWNKEKGNRKYLETCHTNCWKNALCGGCKSGPARTEDSNRNIYGVLFPRDLYC